MSQVLTAPAPARGTGKRTGSARPLLDYFWSGLNFLASAFERSKPLCVFLIVMNFVPLVVLESHSKLLSNDELYTTHVALQPTIKDVWWMSREMDMHPPVHYLAVRESLKLPLPRWFTARLPSIVCGLIACLALFEFGAARFGNLFSLVAVAFFWFSPAVDSGWVNRPYMIWLGMLCLLMVAWSAAIKPNRRFWLLPAMLVIGLIMDSSHMLGVACVLPFVAAEAVRAVRRKRVDWPLVAVICLPTLVGIGFYYQIHEFSKNSFPSVQLPSLRMMQGMYQALVGDAWLIVSGVVLTVLLLHGRKADFEEGPSVRKLEPEEMALLVTLLTLPMLILTAGMIVKLQFWLRYGLASTPAIALLFVFVIARRLPLARMVAAILVACSVGYMVNRMLHESGPQTNAYNEFMGRRPIPFAALDPALPIVAASPMTYLEMSDRESLEISRRTYYLISKDDALKYAGYTLFENEDKMRALMNLPNQTADLDQFLAQHERFYMVGDYGRPEVWLPRALAAKGLHISLLGNFVSSYESDDLWLVTR